MRLCLSSFVCAHQWLEQKLLTGFDMTLLAAQVVNVLATSLVIEVTDTILLAWIQEGSFEMPRWLFLESAGHIPRPFNSATLVTCQIHRAKCQDQSYWLAHSQV